MSPQSPRLLRASASRRAVDAWALVLDSQRIAHQLERSREAWRLWVDPEDWDRADAAVEAYDRENAPAPPEPRMQFWGRTSAGVVVAAALGLLFTVVGPDRSEALFERGIADSDRILAGEVWRVVTALTLHATFTHVLGNALACVVFATAVFYTLGPGLGGVLILLAGAGGNLASAFFWGGGHRSVGASTALFGALGILAGIQILRRSRRSLRGRRAWLPLAGALGLVAMLGTAEGSDVLAHLLGLAVGVPLGVAAARLFARPPGAPVQAWLAATALLAVAFCWSLALR